MGSTTPRTQEIKTGDRRPLRGLYPSSRLASRPLARSRPLRPPPPPSPPLARRSTPHPNRPLRQLSGRPQQRTFFLVQFGKPAGAATEPQQALNARLLSLRVRVRSWSFQAAPYPSTHSFRIPSTSKRRQRLPLQPHPSLHLCPSYCRRSLSHSHPALEGRLHRALDDRAQLAKGKVRAQGAQGPRRRRHVSAGHGGRAVEDELRRQGQAAGGPGWVGRSFDHWKLRQDCEGLGSRDGRGGHGTFLRPAFLTASRLTDPAPGPADDEGTRSGHPGASV